MNEFKRTVPKKKLPTMGIKVPPEYKERLSELRWRLKTPMQQLVEQFICEGIERAEAELDGIDIC